MNLFDGIQRQMFDTVSKMYGYNASWTPSAGGAAVTGRVLLKEPTNEYELNGVEFTPFLSIMEYRQGVLNGLMEAVRSKRNETVVVDGVEYFVRTCTAKYDGKTIVAVVQRKA